MFRSTLRYLKFKPADGLRVVARGKISVYEPKGRVPARLRTPRAARTRRAATRLRSAEETPAGGGAVRRRAQAAAARAAAQNRRRHLARRRRHSRHHQGADDAGIANVHIVIRPARVQGEGAAARHCARPCGDRDSAGRRRRDRRPRRRLDRGPLGLQRRDRRARDFALARFRSSRRSDMKAT